MLTLSFFRYKQRTDCCANDPRPPFPEGSTACRNAPTVSAGLNRISRPLGGDSQVRVESRLRANSLAKSASA